MSYDWSDAAMDAAYDALQEEVEKQIEQISKDSAKAYLGTYGDAVDARINTLIKQAVDLLDLGYCGPALSLAATAIELTIRFLLLRPLVEGAFFSDQWATILAQRVLGGRSAEERELLPAVLRQWGIDITQAKTDSGIRIWEFVVSKLWPGRNQFMHRGDEPSHELVKTAIECASIFRGKIVGKIATDLGFTLETTGKWAEIREFSGGFQTYSTQFDRKNPFL